MCKPDHMRDSNQFRYEFLLAIKLTSHKVRISYSKESACEGWEKKKNIKVNKNAAIRLTIARRKTNCKLESLGLESRQPDPAN